MLGGQVLQARAAIDQQGLGEDPGQSVAAVLAVLAAISPAVRDHCDFAHRRLEGLGAEHELGQIEPVEVPQLLEIGEAAEKLAQRDQERACCGICRQVLCRAKRGAASGAQTCPVPGRPTPPGTVQRAAIGQHNRHRLRPGPAMMDFTVVGKGTKGLVKGINQAGQNPPLHGGSARNTAGPLTAKGPQIKGRQSGSLLIQKLRTAIAAVQNGQLRPACPGDLPCGRRPELCRDHSGLLSVPVSISTRQACRCYIEAFSRADSSRPDRWMWRKVDSVLRCPAKVAITWSSQPIVPGPSDTDAAWCTWKTAARRRRARSGVRPSTRSTTSAARPDCGATPTKTAAPGPATAWRDGADTRPAAPRWTPSTAPSAPGGSWWSPPAPAACDGPDRCRPSAANTAPPGEAPHSRPAPSKVPGPDPTRSGPLGRPLMPIQDRPLLRQHRHEHAQRDTRAGVLPQTAGPSVSVIPRNL
jgi:hypothetical protein